MAKQTRSQALFTYIEGWYKSRQRHLALRRGSPVNFERSRAEAGKASIPRSAHRWNPQAVERQTLDCPLNRGNSNSTQSEAQSSEKATKPRYSL